MTKPADELAGEDYINLETFKRDGRGVKTPVWFARDGHDLVFFTNARAWKVKRLRRNPSVRVAACNVRGTVHGRWLAGECHRLEGVAGIGAAHRALTRKYWLLMRIGNVFATLTRRTKQRAYYRVQLTGPADAS